MWVVMPWLVLAVLYGFFWGWDYGLRKGRAEHAQCHRAIREIRALALVDALMGMKRETDDIKAWEKEL